MPETQDIWYLWLLERRHGGSKEQLDRSLAFLTPIRDGVLDKAQLHGSETLLDVGCGDGLIAVEALQRLPNGHVIFSDISADLLNHVKVLVTEMGLTDRATFLRAAADDLSAVEDESVDVVTHRSVLIYVTDKKSAFAEFYRVLKPEGRLSFFEPINRFGYPEPDNVLWGYDVTPVQAETKKVIRALYEPMQAHDTDPMMDFDERDMFQMVSDAGFRKIGFRLEGNISQRRLRQEPDPSAWDTISAIAPNPKIPTLQEAIAKALDENEKARFIDHMRSEMATYEPRVRSALLYLWAEK